MRGFAAEIFVYHLTSFPPLSNLSLITVSNRLLASGLQYCDSEQTIVAEPGCVSNAGVLLVLGTLPRDPRT